MIDKKHNYLKYRRLKQKSLRNIFYTIGKRTPRYIKNSRLAAMLKKDQKHWRKLIPNELYTSNKVRFNEKFFFNDLKNKSLKSFKKNFDYKSIIDNSNSILNNKMEIFSRKVEYSKDLPVWNYSIDKDTYWPQKFSDNINYHDFKNFGDPRYVWELNRFLHFFDLSRSYFITSDSKYCERICSEIDDWILNNDFMKGINWIEGIEVSIRSINWIFAYQFINKTSDFLEIEEKFVESLYLHGHYISENLSDKWVTNNNHIIAELVGLAFIGNFFYKFNFGKLWFNFAADKLVQELNKQIMDDGFLWESSTGYHKFVTELVYLSDLLLSFHENKNCSDINDILRKMLKSLFSTIKPNGKICKIGDSDDAMVLKLSNFDSDYPDFLKSASISYGMKGCYFDTEKSEYSFWINDLDCNNTLVNNPEGVTFFKNAGFIFFNKQFRENRIWAFFNIGNQSKKYLGAGHRHADLLSFLLNINGLDIIIDSGTYKYFDTMFLRNFFKGTSLHSAPNILDESQIRFQERFETSIDYSALGKMDLFDGENFTVQGSHDAYLAKYSLLMNRRINIGEKIFITDFHDSKKEVKLNVNYIIPKQLDIEIIDDYSLKLNDKVVISSSDGNSKIKVLKSYSSEKYGQVNKSNIVQFSTKKKELKTAISF